MAETWSKAFGRYLRTLRQRRNLSMQEVSSLSQAFAENIDKGYISRCENGYQGPAFSKIIPLSRIYDVSADVLLERMELDMELDRVGSPPTADLSFAELTKSASDALYRGLNWHGYAFLREAVPRAAIDPVKPSFHGREEQIDCALMNCATAGRRLGRRQFALHEFKYVETAGRLGTKLRVILFERLSVSYRIREELRLAAEYATKAQLQAEHLQDPDSLGIAYSNRALIALAHSDREAAAKLFGRAYKSFQQAGAGFSCARSLNNLAQTYFDLGRRGAARRALVAAEKLAAGLKQHRARALSRILMGEIDLAESKEGRAVKHWQEAAEIARKLDDKVLRFKAEFFLYKRAEKNGDGPVARSLRRRLRKLSHWVPKDTPELADFEALQLRLTSSSSH